jgi:N-methylhydantoinase A
MTQAIGIDIGGTFIDIVVADESGLRIAKAPSTPGDPARGVFAALDRLAAEGCVEPARVRGIAHGSTVATNALLEGTWARTGLVTTRGFRDVLEIGRQDRPSLYDLTAVRPPAIVPRDLRFEAAERIDAAGRELTPLDPAEIRRIGERLREARVSAVAITFLFSYLRPDHERAARDILAPMLGVPIILSSDILPEIREFERTSTTVLAAALRPVIGAYLAELETGGAKRGLPAAWRIMQSNGAVSTVARAQERPAGLLLSGPAGGVQGARAIGAAMAEPDLITMDMGGTSCDVAVVTQGEIERTQRSRVGGYPVALPMVAVHTIGAGGGSVVWIDRGGALRVGPESMGARPGPACYGGGGRATVTDAHLVLGRLAADLPLGGLAMLDLDAARQAIGAEVGGPLGLSVEEAALGILEVADAAMERAIRVVTVEKGRDPRGYALLAFGGAGPLHAASIARRLAIPRVLIPRTAGVLSAYGLLTAETGHDFSRSIVRRLGQGTDDGIASVLWELRAQGTATLAAEGVGEREMRFSAAADLRYVGQSHELTVPMTAEPGGVAAVALRRAFESAHALRYGHASPGEDVELVTLRLRAEGPPLVGREHGGVRPGREGRIDRPHQVWLEGSGPARGRLVDRATIEAEGAFAGPLVIVGDDATIFVPTGVRGRCDRSGDLVLEVTQDAGD